MKKSKKGMAALMALAAAFLMFAQKSEACTRAVYLGPDNMVITGRTMDWKEDIMSNLYLFPRGVKRVSYDKGEVVNWTSKYGSIVASAYDLGICDGMNEKGLVASLLFLAVLEYIDGNLIIHEGKQYQVMTNSPRYDLQLAVNDYWKEVGGLQMLPGTNRSSDRFVRASFYVHAIPQTADPKIAVPSVLSIMRNVSVPFGISTPDKPHISSTRWRSVSDQKDRVYYFESTLTPNLFWIDLKKVDFSPKVGVKKLTLTNGEIYAGEANKDFKESKGFNFLFRLP